MTTQTYPPLQMNKSAAARHVGVSVKVFTAKYQPHLTPRQDTEDGNIFFQTKELEALIDKLFNEAQKKRAVLVSSITPRKNKPRRASGSGTSFDKALGKK